MSYPLGCDVSFWQDNNATPGKVDFNKMKAAGAEFVFVRAAYGTRVDSDWADHWPASRVMACRGAYGYLTWYEDAVAQARAFASLLAGDPGTLPPVCDIEGPNPPADATQRVWAYVQEVKRLTGRTPMIYTGYYCWQTTVKTHADPAWAEFPLWLAWYANTPQPPKIPAPWKTWTFWQFSSHGDGPRYGAESGNIDLNYFNGTVEELRAFAGVGAVQTPEVTLEEKVKRLWAAHPEVW